MKKGTDWEDYVHYVYSTLLNLKGERIQVSKRTTFVLPSGETYEVDVYYEFWKAGIRHRVAIECKDWKSPVSQGQVLEFHQKIKNIGNDLIGVVVSRNGYQDGAIKVAERHGMLALTETTFPTIPQLLAQHITTSFIHEPDLIGEPFWCIAELHAGSDGESNGTYYAFPSGFPFNLPVFISKRHAEAFRRSLPDGDRFGVFGLPQYKLRALIAFAYKAKLKLAIVYGAPLVPGSVKALPLILDAKTLKEDFLLMDFPSELEN
ncbi:restriction endonuclease [Burkholderia multivorans]|uniref:restriction endonuclease n=1 Tax=Burkholderia multivorans TaxID=87883 RepID=UPI0021C1F5F8|nr:restriction endonuclease [Burkholderia multivorans]